LTLPAGKWLIQAKGNDTAATTNEVDFQIVNLTSSAAVDYLATYSRGYQRAPFALAAPVSVPSPTTFQLQVLNSSRAPACR
jgi:hypothetical protein